jgi:hypothetical protein
LADNYLAGKAGYVATDIGGTLNTTTGVLSGGITNTANAAGLVQLVVPSTAGLANNTRVAVGGVGGTVEANGLWLVTVVNNTALNLQGSSYANAYTNGGYIGRAYSFSTWDLTLNCSLPKITNFTSGGFQALLAGIVSGQISVKGPYNNTNMAFTVGNLYTWTLGFTTSVVINVPGLIESITSDDDVKEFPKISITAKSTGVFLAAIT